MRENEILKPFIALFNMPCEICHEPIEEWDDYNVKLVIEGIVFGHTRCWHSESDQLREFRKALQKLKKDSK